LSRLLFIFFFFCLLCEVKRPSASQEPTVDPTKSRRSIPTNLIYDTNIEYCKALRAAGKEVEVEVLVNRAMSHSFYLNMYAVDMDRTTGEQTQELIDAIASFVSRH
jgi:acetyl esterase/lipase